MASNKFQRVVSKNKQTTRERSAAAWDRKVAEWRQFLAGAEYRLTQDWCTGSYAENARADIAKAQAELAKLEAE